MTEDQQTLLIIRGQIAGLSEANQKDIKEAAAQLREIVKRYNDFGLLAFALVGAELQIEG